MRIIAGSRRGSRIDAPKGTDTRPTSDRVRENAFNLLGPVDDAVVLDPFAGSGSTLIAAEQTGRRAYLVEIDPLYTDVVVERWQKFTGNKAERIAGPPAEAVA